MIRKKENRPEAADHGESKARNQHWIDLLRSTDLFSNSFTKVSAWRDEPLSAPAVLSRVEALLARYTAVSRVYR